MEESQSLGSMITFTGSVDASWGTTSEEYMEKTWPGSGIKTLKAMETCMKNHLERHDFKRSRGITMVAAADDTSLTEIRVRGSKPEIVQIAQQLAWMMSAFQIQSETIPSDNIYSHFKMEVYNKSKYLLYQSPLKKAPYSHASCWLSMLHGSVIAHGFPIPARGSEMGVEISLAAIFALADIQYPVHIKGVTFLKGWSTLIYPVGASEDFDTIQWHIVRSDDPDDVRLKPNKAPVGNTADWKDVGVESIRKSRSFIGYCRNANIHLGTSSFKAQIPEEKCGASSVKSKWLWHNKITVSMAPNVLGAGGPGIGGEIGLHKRARAKMAESDNFNKILVGSAHTPVIMYDVSTSTGWLVPEIRIALHLARSWLIERGHLTELALKKISSASLSETGGSSALDTITTNKTLQLDRTEEGLTWRFYEIVKDAVRTLRACRDTHSREESSESSTWFFKWFHPPRIYGWDIADLMEERVSIPRKEVAIRKSPKEKWISAIANHPDVLILFCDNIQPPIQPAEPEKICRKWQPVPSGEYYLVASVLSLKYLASYCNGTAKNLRKVTESCSWIQPSGSHPWAECDYESEYGCDRLQRLEDSPSNRTAKLYKDGAVVFGVNPRPPKKCRRPKISRSKQGIVAAKEVPRKADNVRTRAARRGKCKWQSQEIADDTDGDSSSTEVSTDTRLRSVQPEKHRERSKDTMIGSEEDSPRTMASTQTIGSDPIREKRNHQSRMRAREGQDAQSSQSSSEPESTDEQSSGTESGKSVLIDSETLEEVKSQDETISAKEENSDGSSAGARSPSSFTKDIRNVASALTRLEARVQEGWEMYDKYHGKSKDKREIKALMEEMSTILESTLENFDNN